MNKEIKECKFCTDNHGTCSKGFGKPYCQDNPNCPVKQNIEFRSKIEWFESMAEQATGEEIDLIKKCSQTEEKLKLAEKIIDILGKQLAIAELTDYVGKYFNDEREYSDEYIAKRQADNYNDAREEALKELGEI